MKPLHLIVMVGLLLGGLCPVRAQNTSFSPVMVKVVYHGNKVYLRWVPKDFATWQRGNTHGYVVKRQKIASNGVKIADSLRLASRYTFPTLYKPLPEPAWEPLALTNDMAAVAAGAIYSEDFQAAPTGDLFYQKVTEGQKNEDRFGFGMFAGDQDFEVAKNMGLAISDPFPHTDDPNGRYFYQVTLMDPDTSKRAVGASVVDLREPFSPPVLTGLNIATTTNAATFSIPRGDLDFHYSSYLIERSVDGGATWVQRNDKPLVFLSNDESSDNMMFSDTIETPGQLFKYRIRGKTPFNLIGPPSNVVEGMGKVPSLGIYPVLKNVVEANGAFAIDWDFPSAQNNKIKGFRVMRSNDADGGFTALNMNLLGASDRTFTDPSPGLLSNYYKIIVVDENDYELESLTKLGQLNDATPPAVPSGFTAEIDDEGLVKLRWLPNTEPDLKGYRLFYANTHDGEYAQLTTEVLNDTLLKHQLETKVLAKKVYYKILATDFRENDSPMSAPLAVTRPDKVAPDKPLLKKAEAMPNGVQMEWIYSSSQDVAVHKLQRRVATESLWESLVTYPNQPNNPTAYIDSTNTGVQNYFYRIIAVDSAGLQSASVPLEVKPVRSKLDTIEQFKANRAVEGTEKQAKLTWEYASPTQIREFQVYRAIETGKPHLYKTVKVDPEELVTDPVSKRSIFFYRDADIEAGRNYKYQVLAKYPNGSSSPLSKQITFQY